MGVKRKRLRNSNEKRSEWDRMPWKVVSTDNEDLGNFEDAVFFGLEVLDGKAYKYNKSEVGFSVEPVQVPSQANVTEIKVHKKEKRKRSEAVDASTKAVEIEQKDDEPMTLFTPEIKSWGGISLHHLLTNSLEQQGFSSPTPIQQAAITITNKGKHDVVGAAETGSGKTLAFGIPILNSILNQWESISRRETRCPFALILAPTRELALQISKVMQSVGSRFASLAKINVISVVGGLSEEKQRRQLGKKSPPVHILVGTPGRLCELLQDEDIAVLQDLSRLRYLVIDEADRMMEEGHFPELDKLFSRIRDHEILVEQGRDPVTVARQKKIGTYEDGYVHGNRNSQENEEESAINPGVVFSETNSCNDDDAEQIDHSNEPEGAEEEHTGGEVEYDSEADEMSFERMPTEKELEDARKAVSMEEYLEYSVEKPGDSADDVGNESREFSSSSACIDYKPRQRQTLLYSATALDVLSAKERKTNGKRSAKKDKRRKDNDSGMPIQLKQLLDAVGVKGSTKIIDVTNKSLREGPANDGNAATTKSTRAADAPSREVALPKGLQQSEIRVPMEDKDVLAYYFVLQNPGRTLIFVNSIKSARRLDGLLRALNVNCRTIHAQLQQRQRLRALESFGAMENGVLVATDVAARGLDIPKIQSVVHYDVARSPQVYVHRSGRTARAGESGRALSIVSPEDTPYHDSICSVLSLNSLPLFKENVEMLPMIRRRIELARKIFTQSFVVMQKHKEQKWIDSTAKETELGMDDLMIDEVGAKEASLEVDGKSKKALEAARSELKKLLDAPLTSSPLGSSVTSAPHASSSKQVKNKQAAYQQRYEKIGGANKRSRCLFVFAK